MKKTFSFFKNFRIEPKVKSWFGKNLKKVKTFFALFLVSFIVSFLLIPNSLIASGAKFNFMDNDLPLLQGANSTKGEQTWQKSVTADPSDIVSVMAYYHNGMIDTTAKNTMISVQLPKTAATKIVLEGKLSADNATAVTGNLTINSSEKTNVSYIPGSTQLFAEGSKTPVQLGDTITTTGVNIGNIQGCWEHAGYVVFQVKLNSIENPNLTFNKTVANGTVINPAQIQAKSVNANAGEIVSFNLTYTNPSNVTAENVIVKDALPVNLQYVTNSAVLIKNGQSQVLTSELFANGINIGSLASKQVENIIFQTQVNPQLAAGNYTFVNTAQISADKIAPIASSATVLVCKALPPVENPNLQIDKTVANVSAGEQNFVDANTAFAGDTLQYRIYIKNIGNATANNVILKDIFPENFALTPNTTILYLGNDKTNLADISTSGIALGNLAIGQDLYVTFKGTINSDAPVGKVLINTAIAQSGNIVIQDIAKTTITQAPAGPEIKIVVHQEQHQSINIQPKVLGTKTLPATGAAAIVSFIFSLMTTVGYYVRKSGIELQAALFASRRLIG